MSVLYLTSRLISRSRSARSRSRARSQPAPAPASHSAAQSLLRPQIISRVHQRAMSKLQDIPKVELDPAGIFKYILIKVYGQEKDNDEPFVTIVRGYKRCEYHSDIFDEVQAKLNPLDCECIGGGRINHEPENKKIHIYGYSQGYGKADHEVTAKIVKDAYPGYTISISDEGY